MIRSEPGVVWPISLDRPEARSAVTAEMLEDLNATLGDAATDPDARVVLLAGRTEEVGELVASSAPLSVRGSKRAVAAVLRKLSIGRGTEGHRLAEVDMMAADALASEDLAEGLRARRERRPPRFRGT